MTDGTVTHMAGPPVGIGGRVIQRCLVCGEKLLDSLNTAAPLNPDGTPPVFPTWDEGALVRIEPGNPARHSVVGSFMTTIPLPADFCWELVE